MANHEGKKSGSLVAKALAGSWRNTPPPFELSEEELIQISPMLLGSGAGALGWWRVRDSVLNKSSTARDLQQAYRIQALYASVYENEIKEAVGLLRSAQIEPVLVKGWAVARVYPEKGLRPYGDLDICVPPEQYEDAKKIFLNPEVRKYCVDLHEGFSRLDHLDKEELLARSRSVKLDDVEVRILAPEDHLRILCLHLLKHGAFRPLWLCDIAALVESRPTEFNWDICLSGNRRQKDWVACAVGLAHRLLGLAVDDTPVAARSSRLPSWLISQVLKQWESPYPTLHPPMSYFPPLLTYVRGRPGGLQALGKRWPDPIEATVRMNGPFNGFPRLPFQLGYCLVRAAKFCATLPAVLRT
jgi:hypothetical protein